MYRKRHSPPLILAPKGRPRLASTWWRMAACSALVATASCDGSRKNSLTMTTGANVTALLERHDTAIALLADPSDCLSCDDVLRRWLEVRKRRPTQVRLIFTRRPTDSERKQLVLRRVYPDGVLDREGNGPGTSIPTALIWIGGRSIGPVPLFSTHRFLIPFMERRFPTGRQSS